MVLLILSSVGALLVSPAWGNIGYQLDSTKSSRAVGGAMKGIAVDQASQDIYVAIVSTSPTIGKPGEIERFNSNLSADGVFAAGKGFYTGVVVNPQNHDFYGTQVEIRSGFGNFGTPKLDLFSSAGALFDSVTVAFSDSFPTLAADSNGNVFLPNVNTDSVQVFNSTGVHTGDITCSDCPGGPFGKPGSVALDSSDNLYVADISPDRVVKLTLSEGSYVFSSLVQSGRGAGAVAVDQATGDVLVGDMPNGKNFHIVAYTASGTQFDDFGAGLFPNAIGEYGALSSYQMAINATTHKLYVGGVEKFIVFEKATIPPPTATATPATDVGQLVATLNANVNANGHATLNCAFEYTDEADFQINGFSNAISPPCAENPKGSVSTPLEADLTGLTPATDYRFRISAESNAGSTTSANQTFETLPAVPPTVVTKPPQGIGLEVATLAGEINPHGGTVSDCHFELGTSASYGSNIPCAVLPGPATTSIAETEKISGLAPSTEYHYRLVVSSNAGTNAGDDIKFKTSSPPSEPPFPDSGSPAPPGDPPGPTTDPESPPKRRCKVGFIRERVNGESRCLRFCKQSFRKKAVRGKVKCVKRDIPVKALAGVDATRLALLAAPGAEGGALRTPAGRR